MPITDTDKHTATHTHTTSTIPSATHALQTPAVSHTHSSVHPTRRPSAHAHVITLTPKPDTLMGSARDPETLVCSRRRAMIDAY